MLIGINEFDDEFWPALRFAEKDARDMGAALSSFDDVAIAVGPEHTTASGIRAAIDGLCYRERQVPGIPSGEQPNERRLLRRRMPPEKFDSCSAMQGSSLRG